MKKGFNPSVVFDEVEPVEKVATLFYHLAHLPEGCFWPSQVFRTHQEILFSVHLMREAPEYESWIQLAEMQMCELGLVPGKTRSSIRPENEKILAIRPVPPDVTAEATEAEIASMGNVETWQKRVEKIRSILGPNRPIDPEYLEKGIVTLPQAKVEFINEGRGKGKWRTNSRPRGKGKWTWKRYRDNKPSIESPGDTSLPEEEEEEKATSTIEMLPLPNQND